MNSGAWGAKNGNQTNEWQTQIANYERKVVAYFAYLWHDTNI